MADIFTISEKAVTPQVLLHQALQRDDIEAVLMAVRIGDRWYTHWTTCALGGLAMGAMKIFRDVSDFLEADPDDDTT